MTADAPALTALLDELDRLRAAATVAFPWRQDSGWGEDILTADGEQFSATGHPADAALIVAAVNAVPRLTAAVRAALGEHWPIDPEGYPAPEGEVSYCGGDGFIWPCRTYREITAALEGKTDD